MKTVYHVPMEQFGFIEVETIGPLPPTSEDISLRIEAYRAISEAVKVPAGAPIGLTDKEMGMIIENMCLHKTTEGGTELWAKATDTQKTEINRLKRALKRIKAKNIEGYVEQVLSDID